MIKKLTLLIAGIAIVNNLIAQELTSKKGIPIHPQKGNWGIGFDVVPIVKYAGNLFYNSNNNEDISINYPLSITARYLRKDNLAYRFTLVLNNNTEKKDTLVPKIGSTNANEQVADETKTSENNELIGFGIQRWVGKSRVKGYYGGEGAFLVGAAKRTYSYGNALGATNPVNTRIKSEKTGTAFGFMVRAFVGVEVYIAPKIALSAEYGLSPLSIIGTGSSEIVRDSWDGSAVKSETQTVTGKTSTIGYFNSDNNNGSISLLFYF